MPVPPIPFDIDRKEKNHQRYYVRGILADESVRGKMSHWLGEEK